VQCCLRTSGNIAQLKAGGIIFQCWSRLAINICTDIAVLLCVQTASVTDAAAAAAADDDEYVVDNNDNNSPVTQW